MFKKVLENAYVASVQIENKLTEMGREQTRR